MNFENGERKSWLACRGVVSAVAAFSLWGVFPLYFRALSSVSPFEIVCHRIFWSVVCFSLFFTLVPSRLMLKDLLTRPRVIRGLILSSILIGTNWMTYIWAISIHRVLEASLGYFINPIVSMMLGVWVLKESLRPRQKLAVALAGVAVLILTVAYGRFPWLALTLALTFGFYGLIRKMLAIDPISGFFGESVLLLPFATMGLYGFFSHGTMAFGLQGAWITGLLLLAGIVTAVPLILFVTATKRLRLSTVGFLQYIAPTLQFSIAVFVFQEPFTKMHLLVFTLIWTALVIYSADSWVASRVLSSSK